MIFRTLVVLQAAFIALATETTESWTYLNWENHDGVQVGSKYVFFPVPAGTTPEAKTFDEADADCTSKGASLAYPVDDVENAAIIYFLTEHFGGDPAAVASGLGAWLGIIKPDGVQNFTLYDTGEIASYTPFLEFSRLVGEWDICASITFGFQFNEDTNKYEEVLKWDEAFCARTKMPLCMIDLVEDGDCTIMGIPISTDPLEFTCSNFTQCENGNLTFTECGDGQMFSSNSSLCLDARDVPECDIDECALWDNGETDADGNSYCPEFSTSCSNMIGTHNCTCEDGMVFENFGNYWNYSMWTCGDVNECEEDLDNCNENSVCQNTVGGYWCQCNEGYYIEADDTNQCVDYDECLDGIYYYTSSDTNNFTNSAWPPQLLGDPINTLAVDNWEMVDACHAEAACTNMNGTYNCTCNEGYEFDPTDDVTCINIDECDIGTHTCDGNATCSDNTGFYNCTCFEGFDGEGFEGDCAEIDECDTGDHDCDDNADCDNTIGSYECTCIDGYAGSGFSGNCTDIDECDLELDPLLNNCDIENGFCVNKPGKFRCRCNDGFFEANDDGSNCTDWNECDGDNGGHNCADETTAECTNLPGTFNCTCLPGYSGDGVTCEDVDECDEIANGDNDCDDSSICLNFDGGYNCTCNDGYYGDGYECVDSDECGDADEVGSVNNITDLLFGSHECHASATCSNEPGYYNCTCNDGYYGDGIECADSNECGDTTQVDVAGVSDGLHGSAACSDSGSCQNTAGSFNCTCDEGFFGDGFECLDHNECGDAPITNTTGGLDDFQYGAHTCDGNATCSNIPGDYNCTCLDGYSGDGFEGNCEDVNECDTGDHDCDIDATCDNLPGSWNCTCNEGYEGSGTDGDCTDTDECANDTLNNCDSENGFCVNKPGKFRCRCNEGFFEANDDGSNCTDWNECDGENGGNDCDANADCLNTDGGFNCTCKDGYFGDGVICVDSDECGLLSDEAQEANGVTDGLFDSHDCDAQAICANSDGSYTCECNAGYFGDGVECLDYNECGDAPAGNTTTGISDDQWGEHDCHASAACLNVPGDYNCTCLDGFFGDGFECLDHDECGEFEITNTTDGTVDELYNLHECDQNAFCSNMPGNYNCTCADGYFGDGFECLDSDECGADDITNTTSGIIDDQWGINDCDRNAECTNEPGNYNCTCTNGFFGDGFTCEDEDECAELSAEERAELKCHADAVCKNLVGGFNCTCVTGYFGDGFECLDSDECGDQPIKTVADTIEDPNYGENNCHSEAACSNIEGDYNCTCNEGYTGNGFQCSDFNECDTDDDNDCDVNAECTNDVGSYNCTCLDGWTGSGFDGDCVDLNECIGEGSGNDCDAVFGFCVNKDGRYRCRCNDGFFEGNENGTECVDWDECDGQNGGHNCHADATCINTLGSFNCTCNAGYFGDGIVSDDGIEGCLDQNECGDTGTGPLENKGANETLFGTHDCDEFATCTNLPGTFNCSCDIGFADDNGDGTICRDFDECANEGDGHECHDKAECFNFDGFYNCSCFEGYYGDGFECKDGDECAESDIDSVGDQQDPFYDSSLCDINAVCSNGPGDYNCTCNDGWSGDGFNCTDLNECEGEGDGHDCDTVNGFCVNKDGRYRCRCNEGFEEGNDEGTVCNDYDECAGENGGHNCHDDAACVNTPGAFNCTCASGFFGDGFGDDGCLDQDECGDAAIPAEHKGANETLFATHDCHEFAICTNVAGGFNCTCDIGFVDDVGDGRDCRDADECSGEGDGNDCHSDAECFNFDGFYNCSCLEGFFGDGVACKDSDECAIHDIETVADIFDPFYNSNDCAENAHCNNTEGNYTCECEDGYVGDGFVCDDFDECLDAGDNDCDNENGFCVNKDGRYRCRCNEGFEEGNDDGTVCNDIDECADPNACAANADCTNTPGAFNCTCSDGYIGDGFNDCSDINECDGIDGPVCDENAACVNSDGGFNCTCADGWLGTGFLREQSGCVEELIDECTDGIHECHTTLGICMDQDKGYNCTCVDGYVGDGFENGSGCADYDECLDEADNDCDSVNGFCVNKDGKYRCRCNDGYAEANENGTECTDINECESDDTHDCDINASCDNIDGGYNCTCSDGYEGDGTVCDDVDECFTGDHNCHLDFGTCANAIGSFNCTCIDGYAGDGVDCTDFDECLNADDNNCDADNGFCVNKPGKFRCRCNDGYKGVTDDEAVCIDVDECATAQDDCFSGADCINVQGSFNCSCPEGTFGTGHGDDGCDDIDECSDGACDANAACDNFFGGFNCTCNEGWEGSGIICNDADECNNGDADCDANASCDNFNGGYNCTCNEGWEDDGSGGCSDIDECVDPDLNNCDAENGFCVNKDGRFRCRCNDGFEEANDDGSECSDIDECTDATLNDCFVDAICSNLSGSFNCTCPTGMDGDGHGDDGCVDFDECQADIPPCDSNASCFNTVGSFECDCNEGFVGTGLAGARSGCVSELVDECTDGTHTCLGSATCIDEDDGFTCTCPDGFSGDGIGECTDIDECADPTLNNCDADNGFCVNKDGKFRCRCNDGFEETNDDGSECSDIDECSLGTDNCDNNASCENIDGSFTCECDSGFTGDGTECTDVDECSNGDALCDNNASCFNLEGDFNCTCNQGWEDDGFGACTDIDECSDATLNNCDADNGFCVNKDGRFRCRCNDGFEEANDDGSECSDIDECATSAHNCSPFATCDNSDGAFTCECNSGFIGDGISCEVGLVDECTTGEADCNDLAECNDLESGFECNCPDGYDGEGHGADGCTDIDECVNEELCAPEPFGRCVNKPGKYRCRCNPGFIKTKWDESECQDIDECLGNNGGDPTHACDPVASCENNLGSYVCTCPIGYLDVLESGTLCTDINECEEPIGRSACNGDCTNTAGSFVCGCPDGFSGAGTLDDPCIDINECDDADSLLSDNCDSSHGICVNTEGSFECHCIEGFQNQFIELSNFNFCTNINECDTGDNNCGATQTCMDTVGSYECTSNCDEGFAPNGNGNQCKDINECWTGQHTCHAEAACANFVGSFECSCNSGYTGDGVDCFDTDECLAGTDECDENAECLNIVGDYRCECNEGYAGNGTVCVDFDECTAQTHSCHENADCTNIPGSFTCSCSAGYWGLGSGCFDLDECGHPDWNNCAGNGVCTNNVGSYVCSCPDGMGGAGTEDDPCTLELLSCPPFSVEGYVQEGDACDTIENSQCSATCNTDNDFFSTGDGIELNMSFTCKCDRTQGTRAICEWTLTESDPVPGGECVFCPEVVDVTWFGDSTNQPKVCGPEGCLIKSRAQPNFAVAGNWETYTIYILMPGDWIEARFFSWVFDVADVKLEADGSSTLVTLSMNENSPTLIDGEWIEFFFGYDGATEHVSNGETDSYKIGILPIEGSSDQCIMDVNDVRPPESQSRALPRKQRREKLRATAKAERTEKVATFWAEYSKTVKNLKSDYTKTVFIPASSSNNNNNARSSFSDEQDNETVFIPANRG